MHFGAHIFQILLESKPVSIALQWWYKTYPGVPSKNPPFCSIIYFIFQGCIWVKNLQNVFVECTIKCSKVLLWINYILRSLCKHLHVKPRKSKCFFKNMLCCKLATTHKIILHDFTSGGRKVAPHNVVPRGTAWCIISISLLIQLNINVLFLNVYVHMFVFSCWKTLQKCLKAASHSTRYMGVWEAWKKKWPCCNVVVMSSIYIHIHIHVCICTHK